MADEAAVPEEEADVTPATSTVAEPGDAGAQAADTANHEADLDPGL